MIDQEAGKFYEQIEYFPYGNMDGARYYDAKLSRWCSADPAIEDYLPSGDEEYDAYLPGIGGVFNSINLDAYHYAGDNPIKLIDPNGREQKRNKDSWSWLILNYFTGGLWETNWSVRE